MPLTSLIKLIVPDQIVKVVQKEQVTVTIPFPILPRLLSALLHPLKILAQLVKPSGTTSVPFG